MRCTMGWVMWLTASRERTITSKRRSLHPDWISTRLIHNDPDSRRVVLDLSEEARCICYIGWRLGHVFIMKLG